MIRKLVIESKRERRFMTCSMFIRNDDIDHMVMAMADRVYSHEEYQAKTYQHQSLTFVVR